MHHLFYYLHNDFIFYEAMILDGSFRYPNDTEKLMLASQTGLTKSQVFFSHVVCASMCVSLCCEVGLIVMLMLSFSWLFQVSNWFINARVRLWKPMIEEMYKEEFGDSAEDLNPLASNSMMREDFTDHAED